MTDETYLDRQPAIRVMPRPKDTNTAGDIFGGWMMSQVDIAGSIEAFKQAQGRVATVAVNTFTFHKPVFVGDVVSLYAEVVRIGNTSITVDVVVYAERSGNHGANFGERVKVAEATLTYVAIDESRRPRPVAKLKTN